LIAIDLFYEVSCIVVEAQPPTDKRHVPAHFQRINPPVASLHLTLAVTSRMNQDQEYSLLD
jgi:hypothetical protein